MTRVELPIDIAGVKGFLAAEEGEALYRHALAGDGPCLEVGSYCGKSSVYLGLACKARGTLLFAVDHHRGSEEHQPGEAYHDPDLFDPVQQRMDSLRALRTTLLRAGLEDHVVPIVASSRNAARYWTAPLSLVFIDGGHSMQAAQTDYRAWAPRVQIGGVLAIHDLFPDPAAGGQAPIAVYRQALSSGLFEELEVVHTLGILRRLD
jgi:predicted O-methyltransferase YrrM